MTICGVAAWAALDTVHAAEPSPCITIDQGWTNQTANAHSAARGFFNIYNVGIAPDVLTSVVCPIGHETLLKSKQNHDILLISSGAGQSVRL